VDAEGFAALFERHYRSIVQFVFYRVQDRALAEDLAAEVYAIAWRKHLDEVEIDIRWLFATARNLIGNEYQRRDRERRRQERSVMETLAQTAIWSQEIEDVELRLAMARLRPEDSLVLQLTYFQGLTARQAAAFLDCSLPAYWVRQTRARAALRALLQEGDVAGRAISVERGEARG